MERTLIYLIRHGEVQNPSRVRYGRLPGYGLSDLGREQAKSPHVFGFRMRGAMQRLSSI